MARQSTDLIRKYFPEITEEQLAQLIKLADLYGDWNVKINVISRKDMDFIFERHILHALGISKVIRFQPGSKILDIGTGGGVPGLPLAVMFPESNFVLVDSIGKKIKVVEDIRRQLGLKNVQAVNSRAEELKKQFDFVVSRAVAPMETIRYWTASLIRKQNRHELNNGYLFLKGGELNDEIKHSGLVCKEFPLNKYFNEPFFETKKVIHGTKL